MKAIILHFFGVQVRPLSSLGSLSLSLCLSLSLAPEAVLTSPPCYVSLDAGASQIIGSFSGLSIARTLLSSESIELLIPKPRILNRVAFVASACELPEIGVLEV